MKTVKTEKNVKKLRQNAETGHENITLGVMSQYMKIHVTILIIMIKISLQQLAFIVL